MAHRTMRQSARRSYFLNHVFLNDVLNMPLWRTIEARRSGCTTWGLPSMHHRWTIGFVTLVIGCAVPLAEAVAQFYPPYGYPAQPPVYRAVPPVDADDDDDDLPGNRPGDYRGPYQPGPYRAAPRVDPNAPRPYPPYANADPYGAPRPPASIYRDEPPTPYG
jgi:hypothetical protein